MSRQHSRNPADRPDGRAAGGDDRRRALPDGMELEDLQLLIREQRRTTIRARTIAITLESALRDHQEAMEAAADVLERIALRRQWCERALAMAQDVRAHAMRTRRAFDLLKQNRNVGHSVPARFAAADRQIEQFVDRAERAARGGIGQR